MTTHSNASCQQLYIVLTSLSGQSELPSPTKSYIYLTARSSSRSRLATTTAMGRRRNTRRRLDFTSPYFLLPVTPQLQGNALQRTSTQGPNESQYVDIFTYYEKNGSKTTKIGTKRQKPGPPSHYFKTPVVRYKRHTKLLVVRFKRHT